MNWGRFKQAAPKLARKAEELFDRSGLVLLGTVRKDGGPRISPVEFVIHAGEIYLGMMPKSLKARDLLRDPRCAVHSTVSDRMAKHGEFKLHGRAVNVRDKQERRRYGLALKRKIGWSPEEGGMDYHLFKIAVKTAAFFRNEKLARHLWLWRAGGTMKKYKQTIEGTLTEE
jgi:hypothetical protein